MPEEVRVIIIGSLILSSVICSFLFTLCFVVELARKHHRKRQLRNLREKEEEAFLAMRDDTFFRQYQEFYNGV